MRVGSPVEQALNRLSRDDGLAAEVQYALDKKGALDPAGWLAFVQSMLTSEDDAPLIFPEEPEPAVPSMYVDCQHPYLKLGYSQRPLRTRVVPLDRQKYTGPEATARFEELKEKHGWRVVGEPFWDARHWCWRVEA